MALNKLEEIGILDPLGVTNNPAFTVIVGNKRTGKSSLALFLAKLMIDAWEGKFVYVTNDRQSFKKGRFNEHSELALGLSKMLYGSYPSKLRHMVASDALFALQLSNIVPEPQLSAQTYLIDETESSPLLTQICRSSYGTSAILCFRGFENIPAEVFEYVMARTRTLFVSMDPDQYASHFREYKFGKYKSLFGEASSCVCEKIHKMRANTDHLTEFVVCQRDLTQPMNYRQWIDGDVDLY